MKGNPYEEIYRQVKRKCQDSSQGSHEEMVRHVSLLHSTLGLATKDLIKLISNPNTKNPEQKVQLVLGSSAVKRKKSIDMEVEVESSEDEERDEMKMGRKDERRKKRMDPVQKKRM